MYFSGQKINHGQNEFVILTAKKMNFSILSAKNVNGICKF